ncbi:MAG: hypothetical protein KIT11_07955 [Fimbriimonadaceae bacterium]|nr:hypothetical protein [Fimbriimonadaceae bacterium]QYK56287.1 MAG: hypothetical protein KF733_02150 [Fimbriimonadaceae bacterium]
MPQSLGNRPEDKLSAAEAMSFDLELRKDKTFSLQLAFFPMEGEWKLSGSKLTLTPTKLMGMGARAVTEHNGARMSTKTEPLELAVAPDRSTLTLREKKKEGAGEIVFVRNGEGALAKL